MSDEPTREQSRTEPAEQPPVRLSPLVFILGGMTGGSVLLALAAVAVGAPWYVAAAESSGAIISAALLRWSLHRPPFYFCAASYWGGGEQMFICLRRSGHRGRHRELGVRWDDENGPYCWRGRRR